MVCRIQVHTVLLVAQLLVLPFVYASPVSSPEIANKSAKSSNSILAQQQSQQQQQLKSNSNGQDTHLNSLSAFAASYDNLASSQAQLQPTAGRDSSPPIRCPKWRRTLRPCKAAASAIAPPLPICQVRRC